MKNLLLVYLISIVFVSCGGPEPQNTYLRYQNIIILSDMSSRIDNKPCKDLKEIHKITQYFKDECVKPGKKIGDKSSISFSTFSGQGFYSIDLSKIKTLGEKQQFINSTGKYQNIGLENEIKAFESNIKNIYSTSRNKGLDLISVLSEKIENGLIIKQNEQKINGVDTAFIEYENHIYIFTDGYLEYLNKDLNDQFYFGKKEIDKIRQLCKMNNTDVVNVLKTKSSFSLPNVKNKKHKYINLHILQTHERDKDDIYQTYKHEKGLRDNEILEMVWTKWASESGFKNLYWGKY